MKDAIERFKHFLTRRYPDRSTTKHYMSDLAIFNQFVGDKAPREISPKLIDDFVQAQSQQGLKAATINRRLSAISSLFEFLISEAEEDGWRNPVYWKRHSIRPGRHLPRDISDDLADRLLNMIDDARDRAMFTLMLGAGLRLCELLNLRLGDVDLRAKRLRIRSGKGDRDRILPMTQQLALVLQDYLAIREPAATDHLLIYKGAALTGQLVSNYGRHYTG